MNALVERYILTEMAVAIQVYLQASRDIDALEIIVKFACTRSVLKAIAALQV